MKIKRLGTKVSIIVTIMIVLIVAVSAWIASARTDNLVSLLSAKNAASANISFHVTIDELMDEAYARAGMIANSSDFQRAIQTGNQYLLTTSIKNFKSGLDLVLIYDNKGFILASSDDVMTTRFYNESDIRKTLSGGGGSRTIMEGVDDGLYTYGSSIIKASDGTTLGMAICAHDLSLPKYVDKVKERSNCEATIFHGVTRMSTTLIDENGDRLIGTVASEEVQEQVFKQGLDYAIRIDIFGKMYDAYYSPLIVDGNIVGMLYTGIDVGPLLEQQALVVASVIMTIVILGAVCIVLLFIFNMIAISRPLKKISLFVDRIKDGDLGIASGSDILVDVKSADEIGVMARSLESAFSELRSYIEEIKIRMQALADGDLVTESTFEFRGDFILIKNSINDIVHYLDNLMKNFTMSAAQVSVSSTQIADGAKLLAQGALVQASSVDELSATIGDILKETEYNAGVTKEAMHLSDNIRDYAEKGSVQMNEMVKAIEDINEASGQISKVIKAIDDIAFQTNILALNAAVEAARAGIHGKGFAVVADEVRDLANKSAVAAHDTADLIANSVGKANHGLSIANETAESLKEIVEGINHNAEIITRIAESSIQQADAISQVNAGIDQVSTVVRQNSATAEESAAASAEMNEQSQVLKKMIQHFKISGI